MKIPVKICKIQPKEETEGEKRKPGRRTKGEAEERLAEAHHIT